jgi:hypothetical protein
LAGQPLWLAALVGSSFGLYPAIEIDLHLARICAAQRQSPAPPEGAFRPLNVRHQPAPPSLTWGQASAQAAAEVTNV